MSVELEKSKLGFCFIVLFITSGIVSCGEIKYVLWGETTDATIVSVTRGTAITGYSRSSSRTVPVKDVRYKFAEKDGTEREGVVSMSIRWEPPKNRELKIDYVPGHERKSRLHGDNNNIQLMFFLGSSGALVIWFGYLFWKGSRD